MRYLTFRILMLTVNLRHGSISSVFSWRKSLRGRFCAITGRAGAKLHTSYCWVRDLCAWGIDHPSILTEYGCKRLHGE